MNSLSIHTLRAEIEITSRPARLYIENNMPSFDIRRELPSMRIERQLPQFIVNDEYQKVDKTAKGTGPQETGTKTANAALTKTGEDDGKHTQSTETAISVTVKDSPEMNVGLKSREKARLEWEPGYCTIEWTDPVLQIEWDSDFMPTIECEPYAVEVRLRNRPLVLIRVNLENIPGSVGVRVDQRI